MSTAIYIVIAVAAGLAGGLQALINSNLNKSADLPLTTLVVNTVAFVGILVIYLLFSRQEIGVLRNAQWYSFTGGILGIIVVMGTTFLVPKLGLTVTSSLFIVSQLSFVLIADHFGFLGSPVIPVDLMRAGGIGFMMIGLYMFFK